MKNNFTRFFSAILCLLIIVGLVSTSFTPAKYRKTFDGVDIGLTVNAVEPEEPTYSPVLASEDTWYSTGGDNVVNLKPYVYSITVVDSYTKDENISYSYEWDASEDRDGSIMCYLFPSYDENGTRRRIDPKKNSNGTDLSEGYAYDLVIAGNGSGKVYSNKNSVGAFKYFEGASQMDLSALDTSYVENFNSFFDYCRWLLSLDLRGFDTRNGKSFNRMFAVCDSLLEVETDESFTTSSATNLSSMFFYCYELEKFDVSHWDTSNVVDMTGLFCGCHSLKVIDVSNWDTSSLTKQAYDKTNSNATGIFRECYAVEVLDVSNWDVSNVSVFMDMFYACESITELDLRNFDTSKAINMYRMFSGCKKLKTIYATESFTTENVYGYFDDSPTVSKSTQMFTNCTSLVGGYGTAFDSQVTDRTYARIDGLNGLKGYFTDGTPKPISVLEPGPTFNARIRSATTITFATPAEYPQFTWGDGIPVDVNSTGSIQLFNDGADYFVLCEGTIATGKDCSSMFNYCQSLTEIIGFNSVNTSDATTMEDMFCMCSALESVDLSMTFTHNVTDMSYMFWQCNKLKTIDVSGFDTRKVTNMHGMFYACQEAENLDVSGFKTSNVKNMGQMFSYCSCQTDAETINVSNFDTANVTNMQSMFSYTSFTELDLSNFDTNSVTTMSQMFYATKFTEIDISSFSTPALTNIDGMFSQNSRLKTIYASRGWVTNKLTTSDSASVFEGCKSLEGGSGTLYDASNVNKVYARIDMLDGTNTPGYFTQKDRIFSVIYHSFDDDATPYRRLALPESEYIPYIDAPERHTSSGLSFRGWSYNGLYGATNKSGSLANSNGEQDVQLSGDNQHKIYEHAVDGEVHLYDVYNDYYVLVDGSNVASGEKGTGIDVIVGITATDAASENIQTKNFYSFASSVATSGSINGVSFAKYNLHTEKYYLYVHPGAYVYVDGETVNDTSAKMKYWTVLKQDGTEVLNKSKSSYTFQHSAKATTLLVDSGSESTGSSGSGSCFAAGTLITMADGSQLPIEEIRQGDMVRVYDHENGCYTKSAVLFTEYDGDAEWHVANLEFSDGTTQEFIYDHGLFDLDLNKYVYITPDNCEEFIGHRFAKERGSGYKTVILEKAWAEVEYTGCYSMTTTYHMNYFVNGMFSMPGGIPGLFNFFEYDEDLKYDPDLMERDIERYGLFTYDDFADYMPEAVFEQIFPIKYLKVSIGKGLTTFKDLEEIIERYIYGHDLLDDFEELPEEELEEELEEEEETEETTEDESEELEESENSEENTEENGETETKDESTDKEKATLTFEVKNLTFDFTDDEIVKDEDVVITFTAGEGYELPETIIITIDGEKYIICTSEEDSDKNPEGITFDIETGTLTISKDLLKDTEAITIAAEGIKKEDEESEDNKENTDADKKDESEDKDNTDNENESEGGETTDKETENGTNSPDDDKTETEGGTDDSGENNVTEPKDGTDVSGGENTETTTPETNPDNSTEGEAGGGNNSEDNGEDEGKTETPEPDTDVTTPTTPDKEDGTNTEQGGEKVETEGNGEGSTENGTEETIPDTEGNVDDETTIPTEPTTPAEPSEPAVSPETPKTETPSTSEPTTGGNDDDNGEIGSADSSSTEISINSGNDSPESDASSESTTSTTPSATPPAPTTSSPVASETSTPSASTQASSNSSNAPASSAPAPNADSNSNGASQASGTTAPSGSKETSSEE